MTAAQRNDHHPTTRRTTMTETDEVALLGAKVSELEAELSGIRRWRAEGAV